MPRSSTKQRGFLFDKTTQTNYNAISCKSLESRSSMADFERTFLAIVGPPGTGKSTLAALVAKATSIRHVDIDDNVRTLYFGKPRANDGTNSEIERLDRLEMAGSYDIFFGIIEGFFHAEKPLIATCTLSSEIRSGIWVVPLLQHSS